MASDEAFGGGVSVGTDISGGNITLTNNIFINNSATSSTSAAVGGGASVSTGPGTIRITNNTFTLNSARSGFAFINTGGGGLSVGRDPSSINIHNNIVFSNTATGGHGADILVRDGGPGDSRGAPVNLLANDVSDFFSVCANTQGCIPNISRRNNINRDPLFVDAVNGNVHLRTGSPAINAGTSSAPALPATDFEGDPRIVGSAPDIGADEHNPVRPTPVGTNVTVQSDSVKITFANVATAGATTVTPIDPTTAGTLPGQFKFGTGLPAFDIRTTARVTGPITVCIQVSSSR